MVWIIKYTDSARKQLKKLDKQSAIRILDFMDARISGGENPRSTGKVLSGPKLGTYWRYRVGDYRIICNIQDHQLCVLVIEVGNRKEVYR
ncbi:type II toxin-antitoxin system RelE/ParE family toxin [Polynucleobacter sp. UB-Tiil-W10]|uniref:type II toxin-antitoxin system RelE family toxin n=1 Tax=Polynucleobacter sp. UB-Tiil-W10 TaxID=1855648 RepID=UPI001C0B5AAB|nr:type II toxin-antitoxin system RelE/ParE family toxin [Polynucleobacter sp. UB-Tiil-W10]MBU3540844.1 type II toxin-antitoxin system RelE/ParE family toxin [Polynucleobacter sp. UB-Tiil-W10]